MERWLLIIICSFSVLATDYYVLDGATGDGSDWNNALGSLPYSLERGSTYYLADGEYGQYKFDDNENGQWIIIKKATIHEHGTGTGWKDEYGDGVAVFKSSDTNYGAAFRFEKGYYEIDGSLGEKDSGHGIKLSYTYPEQSRNFHVFTVGKQINNLKMSHIEFESPGRNYDTSQPVFVAWDGGSYNNILLSHVYARGFGQFAKPGRNWIIENSYFRGSWSSSAHHGELLALVCTKNLTFRYNIVDDACEGTGGIIALGSYDAYLCDSDDIRIYGNIFKNEDNIGNGLWATGNSDCSTGMTNWQIYNNVVFNMSGKFTATERVPEKCSGYSGWPGSGNIISNNLFYHSNAYSTGTGTAFANNYYNDCSNVPATGSIISDDDLTILFPQVGSFMIGQGSDAKDAGKQLGQEFSRDMAGNVRGADGYWDIGAFEYSGQCKPLSLTELINFIDGWKSGTNTIQMVMEAISEWKHGC